nr:hypothetical protein CFP56_07725 [Quercus suber]
MSLHSRENNNSSSLYSGTSSLGPLGVSRTSNSKSALLNPLPKSQASPHHTTPSPPRELPFLVASERHSADLKLEPGAAHALEVRGAETGGGQQAAAEGVRVRRGVAAREDEGGLGEEDAGQAPADGRQGKGEEAGEDGEVEEEALQLVAGLGVAVQAEVGAVEGAGVEERPAAVHDRGVAGALQAAGEDAEVGDGAQAGQALEQGPRGSALGRRRDGAERPGLHRFGDEGQRRLLEHGHDGRERAAGGRGVELVGGQDQLRGPDAQRVADVRDQRQRHEVGRRALDPVLRDDDGAGALRRLVVLADHVVDPGDFARDIEVMRARLRAGFQDRGAVFHVRPDGGDEHFGLLGQAYEVVLLQLRRLDPGGLAVRVERSELGDQLLELGFIAAGHRPSEVGGEAAGDVLGAVLAGVPRRAEDDAFILAFRGHCDGCSPFFREVFTRQCARSCTTMGRKSKSTSVQFVGFRGPPASHASSTRNANGNSNSSLRC